MRRSLAIVIRNINHCTYFVLKNRISKVWITSIFSYSKCSFMDPLNAEVYQVEEEIYRRNYPLNLLLSLNPEVVSCPTHFDDDVAEVEEDDIMDESIGKNTPVQGM